MNLVLKFMWACLMLGLASGAAVAQSKINTTFTSSTSTSQVITAQTLVNRIDTFQTQVVGKISGGNTVFDQTFRAAFSDPSVQAALTAARTAITTAGGPGIIVLGPTLTNRSVTLLSSSSATVSVVQSSVVTVTTEPTIGPATIIIGNRDLGGTAFFVLAGRQNLNTNTHTVQQILQTTTTTNTFLTSEVYTLTGTVQALGLVHGAVPSLVGDNNERFTRRLLDEAIMGEGNGWADGFGWRSAGNGDTRSGAGLDGGAGFNANGQWRWGFGVSQGWTSVDLDNAGGSASGELTELGLYARWHDKGAYLAAAAVGGFGSTSTSSTTGGSTMAASYGTSLVSLAGEAGYEMDMGGWSLVPNIGGQWQSISVGGFTETGAFALASTGNSYSFGKGWAGLKAQRQFDALTLAAYGRVAVYSDTANVPVTFAGGTTLMNIAGSNRGTLGFEAGLSTAFDLSPTAQVFAAYDFKLRDQTISHAGTAGLKVSW